jgi:hypothetical protein
MKIPIAICLLFLAASTAAIPARARADRDVELGPWDVSIDQRIYVNGILGETVFENHSPEAVVIDWGRPCASIGAYPNV